MITNDPQRAVSDYWTPERMQAAKPYPVPARDATGTEITAADAPGEPGLMSGNAPGREADAGRVTTGEAAEEEVGVSLTHARDPIANYPPPGNRSIVHGKFRNHPHSQVGKLFFTGSDGLSYVCSGGVQFATDTDNPSYSRNRFDLIITAGHCLHDGGNGSAGWHSNFLFCPAWSGAPQPDWGCWSWTQASVDFDWFNSGDIEQDFGGFSTPGTSTNGFNPAGTNPDEGPGNVTGRLGYAWNWFEVADTSVGYPHAAPFNGNQMVQCAAIEWYRVNWSAFPDDPKYIGCDATGGTSGGPWVLGWGKPNTPNNGQGTQGNWTNGVNSHRRITANPCGATGNLCVRELASPAWTTTAGGAIDFIEDTLANLA